MSCKFGRRNIFLFCSRSTSECSCFYFFIKYFYRPLVVVEEMESFFSPFAAIAAINLYSAVLNFLLFDWGASVEYTLLFLMTCYASCRRIFSTGGVHCINDFSNFLFFATIFPYSGRKKSAKLVAFAMLYPVLKRPW